MKKTLLSLTAVLLIFTGCGIKKTIKQTTYDNEEYDKSVNIEYDDLIEEKALHDAVRAKDIEQVKLLLSQNISVNTKDIYGYTPLHLASRLDAVDIAKELISKGAQVNSFDNYKDTPLIDAVRNNFTQMSKLLICSGAYRNITDVYDMSPLHSSVKNKNLLLSEMLIAKDLTTYCSEEKKVEEEAVEKEDIEDINETKDETQELFLDQEPEKNEVFKGLYEALNEEFKDDLDPWNARLTKDLFFRFEDPQTLFAHGKSELNEKFKAILNDFVPRYLKVLENYKEQIEEIRIEGHTSSSYTLAKNEDQRYLLNKELSQKRADEVKIFVLDKIKKDALPANDQWSEGVFNSYGMSYDNLILNEDGSENETASRRVEFKIQEKQ